MSARRLWEELTSGGFARAEAWVREPREESVHLEFKRANPDVSLPSKKDRSEAARTLSAFANVEGGVLVFGIETTSRSKQPDAASGLDLLADARAFAVKLRDVTSTLTYPTIPGIRVEPILKGDDAAGLVAIYVPARPDLGPFRVVGDVEKEFRDRYYQRSARGSEPMPHQILGAMFGRVPSPRLHLKLVTQPAPTNPESLTAGRFDFDLVNLGRGTARTPSLRFRMQADTSRRHQIARHSSQWKLLPARASTGGQPFRDGHVRLVQVGDAPVLIYPDDALYVSSEEGAPGTYEVSVRIDAEGAQPVESTQTIEVSGVGEEFWFPPLPEDNDE